MVGLAEYFANALPIISSSLVLLFERFSKKHLHYQERRYGKEIVQLEILVNSHQYTFTNSTVTEQRIYNKNLIF